MKTIIFDIGNVLIDLDFHRTIDGIAKLCPSSLMSGDDLLPEYIMTGGHADGWVDQFQAGLISSEQAIQNILQHALPGTTPQQVVDAWNSMILGIPDKQKRLLSQLHQQGTQIIILSNTNALHVEWMRLHCPEFKYADYLFYSNEMHVCKPDLRCYQMVIDQTHIVPEQTWYVDDLLPNIEAGRQMGFQCIHAVGGCHGAWVDELLGGV